MGNAQHHQSDPKLDLLLERIVDVPRELVWRAWTIPELVRRWFTPSPWKTVDCDIDLRPGGVFSTIIQSPDGQNFPNSGCYLEIVPNERLIFTTALMPGYRPNAPPENGGEEAFQFTAIISFEPHGNKTRYSALVKHANEAACKRHEAMGFQTGWGAALDQLVALAKTIQLEE